MRVKKHEMNRIPSGANCGSEQNSRADACNPNYDEKQKFPKLFYYFCKLFFSALKLNRKAKANFFVCLGRGKLNGVCITSNVLLIVNAFISTFPAHFYLSTSSLALSLSLCIRSIEEFLLSNDF